MKRALIAIAALALVVASAAYATKPGSGSDTGRALVFAPNPVQDLGIQTIQNMNQAVETSASRSSPTRRTRRTPSRKRPTAR